MKLKRIAAVLLIWLLLFTSITGTTSSAAVNNNSPNWPSGPKPKSLSCDSAIVMEVSTGSILYKKNIHKQHYPASITKIMTTMLALENSSLSDTVTFSSDAVYGIEPGSSTVYSDVGEKMSMEQCLYAIMLESANEACLAVGEHIAGDTKSFVKLMNDKVSELGLKNTHFNNPNGLPDPKHYTTAYDMAVIAREAIQNSAFRKITGTRYYTCAKTNTHKQERVWLNHHQMVNGYQNPEYEYKYCIGGKTGYTNIAHSTLVTFAEKNGMQLVSVIMYANSPKQGEPNEYTDTTSILNFGFGNYKKYSINEEKTDTNSNLFNTYNKFFNADSSPIHLSNESAVVLPKGVKLSSVRQKMTYNKKASIKDGENIIGKVTYTYKGKVAGSTDIIYEKTAQNHLDEASREIVNSEIEDIEENTAKTAKQNKRIAKIKNSLAKIFSPIIAVKKYIKIPVMVIGVVLLLAILVFLIKKFHLVDRFRNRNRRHKSRGGYRSKAGRKTFIKRQRQQKRMQPIEKNKRRNQSKYYKKNVPSKSSTDNNKHRKNTNYSKRRKNTRESFGKNYFDF